jgi:hypothetical protein
VNDTRGRRVLVFAVNTFGRFNTAASNEYDVLVDTDGDGNPDFSVTAFDFGAVTAGAFDGRVGVFVVNLRTQRLRVSPFLAAAPTDGSTLLLPVLASQLSDAANPRVNLTPANPRISYTAQSLNLVTGDTDATNAGELGFFNVFAPAVDTGQLVTLRPGDRANVAVRVDAAEFARTPAKGLMIVNLDDRAGAEQADLLRADGRGD